MPILALIRTAPPEIPGSMAAYGELVQKAVAPLAEGWEVSGCDLFDPSGGGSMWRHHLWRLRNVRRILAGHPADLYHWLDGSMAAFIPAGQRCRSLVTVHDLIPLLQLRGELPGRPSLPAAWLIQRGVKALGDCAGLCAVSGATRNDLARLAGIEEGVEVIPHPPRPLPPQEPVLIPELNPNARFILHVGNNAAYKNRRGVLDVFSHLRDCVDLHLVLAGPPPLPELRAVAKGLCRVHFAGPVNDAQLSGLYHRAALFLFPSLYEGYGMPVLEAMAAGCPVVCSTAAALVAVAADAALFASADDPDAMATQCRSLLSDESLRQRMVECGRIRAATFDIDSMGRSLMGWYKTVLNAVRTKESHV